MNLTSEEKALMKGLLVEEISTLNHKEFEYDEMYTTETDAERKKIIHTILVSIEKHRRIASGLLNKLETN